VPKISVINADDPSADYFAAFPADKIIRYGFQSNADIQAMNINYKPDWTFFVAVENINNQPKIIDYQEIRLAGEFNVYNALAAIATAYDLHVKLRPEDGYEFRVLDDETSQGVVRVRAIPGRMERIDEGQNFTAIVDFAHTPNALEKVLTAARQMLQPDKRLIAVFGSAGLRDREKRRMMAETSARLADVTILTAEDPRTESLDGILQVMADACISQGSVEGQTFFRVPDRGEALYQACQMAHEGDIVIACGKGHEQSMCFGTIEYAWDDREAMRAALRGAPLRTLPTAK
jgi:UDP-N-acetylmuramoyl-L-alanyl-D-glutamate--2,6-diaminopimelate ligase